MKVEELVNYGIPEEYIRKLKEDNISELYPPQADVIRKGLFKDRNLVVSMPTAGGKTLIATMSILHTLQEKKHSKAVYIAPLVALASEKYQYFKKFFDTNYKVALSVGDLDSADPWLNDCDIICLTTEKLDSLLRHNVKWVNDIRLVIVDEIHTLNDSLRGPTLEILLTKLIRLVPQSQILGLSATIRNSDELSKWLNATLVINDFRPVKLYEGVSYDSKIHFEDREGYDLDQSLDSENAIIQNTLELNKQALVFTSTRKNAESLAERLSKTVKMKLKVDEQVKLNDLADQIENVLESPTDQCRKVSNCIRSGVVFHHAGLLGKQKTLIEDNFRKGLIKAIAATPTLCLHPDTQIISENKVKKVHELSKCDKVLTHEGQFQSVTEPLERKVSEKILAIKPFGSLEVKMTREHRVFVLKETRHRSHYANGTQRVWYEYDGPFWMKASQLFEAHKNNRDEKASYHLLQPIPKTEITSDRIHFKKEASYVHNQFGKTGKIHPAGQKLPKEIPLNYDTSRLFGLWIAEGSVSKTGAIIFDIATYEDNLTSFIKSTVGKYFPGMPISIKDHERHRRRITFCNKFLATWLKDNFGGYAETKRVPNFIFSNKDSKVRLGILHGLIDGDGYIRIDNKSRAHYASHSTVSPTLAFQVQLLLASLGYIGHLSRRENHRWGKHPLYSVRIGGDSYYRFLSDIKEKTDSKKGNRAYNINKIWKNYLLLQLDKIKEEHYSGPVYNLEVDNDQSYSVGFIVHNSMGVNLPAFRVLIRDVKRYSEGIGSDFIPVLEYKQFVGRAGRPGFDSFGESILIAKAEDEAKNLVRRFIYGEPEDIQSKLSLEPVLRTHILALIASGFCDSLESIYNFFSDTFYAHQYGDIESMKEKIDDILMQLNEWKFLTENENLIYATRIGKRISELYIDPMTAHNFLEALKKKDRKELDEFTFLQLLSNSLEIRPALSVKSVEVPNIEQTIMYRSRNLITDIPEVYDLEYEDFLKSIKTAMMFDAWIKETSDDRLLSKFGMAPGDLYNKLKIIDWLAYSLHEMALLSGYKDILQSLKKLRLRLEYGIKEELIPLVRLKEIGRVRARRLYNAGLDSLDNLRRSPIEQLNQILGFKVAEDVKRQVGTK